MDALYACLGLTALAVITLRAAARLHDRRCCHFANTTHQENQ